MKPYFVRVGELSPTMFWINNPTRRQADIAIEHSSRVLAVRVTRRTPKKCWITLRSGNTPWAY